MQDGPLKENWKRELQKLTNHQPRLKNDFDFGTKLRFINPFPHVSLKPTCVSITWTLIFELFQKPGDFGKNRETGRMHQKTGDSIYIYIKSVKSFRVSHQLFEKN